MFQLNAAMPLSAPSPAATARRSSLALHAPTRRNRAKRRCRSVSGHPATCEAGSLEVTAQTCGRLTRTRRADDEPVPYALFAEICFLHVGRPARKHGAVLFLHIREDLKRVHARLLRRQHRHEAAPDDAVAVGALATFVLGTGCFSAAVLGAAGAFFAGTIGSAGAGGGTLPADATLTGGCCTTFTGGMVA